MNTTPPRFAEWILFHLLEREEREFIIGDLMGIFMLLFLQIILILLGSLLMFGGLYGISIRDLRVYNDRIRLPDFWKTVRKDSITAVVSNPEQGRKHMDLILKIKKQNNPFFLGKIRESFIDNMMKSLDKGYVIYILYRNRYGRDEMGVIDYQDVLVGPDTYDAVSLLGERGMPRLLPKALREGIRESWAGVTAASEGWSERWKMVSLQRGLKVLGTFARLSATGLSAYDAWIDDQIDELSAQTANADAPSELVDLLLDLSRRRHRA